MRELSLHLIDIIQNSIVAKATLIEIEIEENIKKDFLRIIIKDNGSGMGEEMLKKVKDPFVTSRKTRKVGLGLSLFEAACEKCDGHLNISSELGVGTIVEAVMKYNHIDRTPIGRIDDTIITTLYTPDIDIVYVHKVDEKEFVFDTREIKNIVGEDLTDPEILQWIKEYIDENITNIGGGMW